LDRKADVEERFLRIGLFSFCGALLTFMKIKAAKPQ